MVGSICTIAFVAALVFVLFAKTILFLENDPKTFTVAEGIEFGYYGTDSEFDQHQIAVGLIYKPEHQAQMDLVKRSSDFTTYLESLVNIEMFT